MGIKIRIRPNLRVQIQKKKLHEWEDKWNWKSSKVERVLQKLVQSNYQKWKETSRVLQES